MLPPRRGLAPVDCLLIAVVALVTLLTSLFFMSEPLNDHFMHLVWARQLIAGELPLRDFDEPGMPLQVAASALMQLIVGHRLVGEAILVAAAFVATGCLLYIVVQSLSGSRIAAVIAGSSPFLFNPRSYGYPKLLLYIVAALLILRYVDKGGSRARAIAFGVCTAIALLFRLDHGFYLAIIFATVILMLRGDNRRRDSLRELGTASAVCLLVLLPWLAWVQFSYGLPRYVDRALSFAQAERSKNPLRAEWYWPITSWADVLALDQPLATISIRWAGDATAEQRAEIESRYGLEKCCNEDGRYHVRRDAVNRIAELLRERAVVDTAGIDRAQARVESPSARWRARLPGFATDFFPSLATAENAAAFLYVLFWCLPALALLVGLVEWRTRRLTLLPIVPLVVMAVLTMAGFVRAPLTVRIGDALVPQMLLIGWLWGRMTFAPPRWRVLAACVMAIALSATLRAGLAVGLTSDRVERMIAGGSPTLGERWREAGQRLFAVPPGAAIGGDRALPQVVDYLRTCTKPDEAVLITLFRPEVYYYSSRRFAGRLAYYLSGFWDLPEDEAANLRQLSRDRPSIVLAPYDRRELATFPQLLRFLDDNYRVAADIGPSDDQVRLMIRRDLTPAERAAAGVPCYAPPSMHAASDR